LKDKRSLRHGTAHATDDHRSESRSSSGPPIAHGSLAGPAAGGAKVGMRRRVGPLRVEQLLQPAYGPRSQEWSRGRRCRDAHASTRSLRGPSTAGGPGWAHGRRCRFVVSSYSAVQLRRGPRTAHGPSWSRGRRCPAEHAAQCRSCVTFAPLSVRVCVCECTPLIPPHLSD
jgi:hypothetical protein